eukprot:CAMPEP_0185848240 /NCGR_PEP_ID=MMETSP1354-20130828/3198_1 /TAXON_ID=708628 /ORGANISM="Erythrolobus madagascarensis, Strain CCMP3276" /LENGTH=245 /DNA_ID=CAMNT_0028548619 /DNA_START=61 /DNA_END=798 /DNA_ORIENTATION=-
MGECSAREVGFDGTVCAVTGKRGETLSTDMFRMAGEQILGAGCAGMSGGGGLLLWDELGVQQAVEGLRDELSQILDPALGTESPLGFEPPHSAEVESRDADHDVVEVPRPVARDIANDSECSFLTPNTTPEFGPNIHPAGAAGLPDLALFSKSAQAVKPEPEVCDESKFLVVNGTSPMREASCGVATPRLKVKRKKSSAPKRYSKTTEAGGKYEFRKRMANSRPRVNGRFIKIEDKESVFRAMQM